MVFDNTSNGTDWWTEGFDVTILPNSVQVSSGRIVEEYTDTQGLFALREHSYDAFEFDVLSDPELFCVYDVYLLETPGGIAIDCTPLMDGIPASYSGEEPAKFTLMTFTVPVGAKNTDDVNIFIKRVVKDYAED